MSIGNEVVSGKACANIAKLCIAKPWWKLSSALAILLLSPWSLPAQAEDLLAVYRLAQNNDPVFEAAHYTFTAAQEKIPQARAGLLPVVNLTGNDGVTSASNKFSGTPEINRNVNAWTWNLQLTQPLLRLQNIYAYRESEFQVEVARAQFAKAEQDLILRVTQAYFDVLIAQETIQVADAQFKATNEQLEVARHGFSSGVSAITDVHEAKSRSDLAHAQQITGINDLEAKRAELEKLIGQAPQILTMLQAMQVIPQPQPYDVSAWIAQAQESNPAVQGPKAALKVAEAEVKRNRAEYLPTLDLVASYGQNYSSNTLTLPNDFSTRANTGQASLQLTVPLFAGMATSSRVTEAMANKNKAAAELEAARRQASTDARQAYAAIVNGLAQIEALASAVDSSKSAVTGNQVGYRLGIHINIDVLNAEQQLYTAQRDLVKARYDTLLQGLKLKAAAGALTEADVVVVNGFLAR